MLAHRLNDLLTGQSYFTDMGRVIINTVTIDESVRPTLVYVEYYFPREPHKLFYATEAKFRAMLRR
jgi:hypothetical protein